MEEIKYVEAELKDTDPNRFVDTLIELVSKGAVKKENSYVNLIGVPFKVKMNIPEDSLSYFSKKLNIKIKKDGKATKQSLQEMPWEALKYFGKVNGVVGRSREDIIREYLKKVE